MASLLSIVCRPIAFKKEGENVLDIELTANPYPTWKKLEEMVDKGKVRNIGISKCVDLENPPQRRLTSP